MKAPVRVLAMLGFLGLAGGAVCADSGTVAVSYTLFHLDRRGSNQVAVWIETQAGAYVKTLFATRFMAARRGFKLRPQCAPEWVKAAGVARMSQEELDAVSGATQPPGRAIVSWDCTDSAGRAVSAGTYVYKVEGNISMEKRVLWTGRITVGARQDASLATPAFIPEDAKDAGVLLRYVGATYTPGP